MDGRRFDDLARTLAARGTRRGFLAGVAGAITGLTLAGRVEAACPADQVRRGRAGCVCRSTGRPPESGECPCRAGEHRCDGVCTRKPCDAGGGGGSAGGGGSGSDRCAGDGACAHLSGTCTTGVCNQTTGECEAQPNNPGGACTPDPTNLCTLGACQDGSCVATDLRNCSHLGGDGICSGGVCNPATGTCSLNVVADGIPCPHPDRCVGPSFCLDGICTGAPKNCSSVADACNDGVCRSSDGACVKQPKNEGGSCSTGDPCAPGGVCRSGVCQGTQVSCDSPGLCQSGPGTCNPATGQCEYQNAPDYSSCGSGVFCCNGTCCGADEISCQAGMCSGSCVPPGQPCPASSSACCSGSCNFGSGLCV